MYSFYVTDPQKPQGAMLLVGFMEISWATSLSDIQSFRKIPWMTSLSELPKLPENPTGNPMVTSLSKIPKLNENPMGDITLGNSPN